MSRIRKQKMLAVAAACVANLVAGTGLCPAEEGALRVGYSVEKVEMTARMTKKDVEAATQILLREMLRERTELVPKFKIFDKTADLIDAVKAGEIDFAEIHPVDYFRMPEAERAAFRPGIFVQLGDSRLENLVLLGQPGLTLEGAAGKSLRVYRGRDRGLGEMWLASLLKEGGLPAMEGYFGEVVSFDKPEKVLLPTFFGKSDLCVMMESDYRVAVELNPQVGKRLVPVKRSGGMPFVIAGTTSAASEELAKMLNSEIAPSLRSDPGGRQALALLGVKSLGELRPGDLDVLQAVIEGADAAGEEAGSVVVETERGEP